MLIVSIVTITFAIIAHLRYSELRNNNRPYVITLEGAKFKGGKHEYQDVRHIDGSRSSGGGTRAA